MAASKCIMAGLVGASMQQAAAFVAPGAAAAQPGALSQLRGATQTTEPATTNSYGTASAAVAGVASMAVLGSFASAATRGQRKRVSSVICKFSPEKEIGAMDPVGFFDPAGLCKDEATFKDFRAKELKHGRLAMMGALGMLTQSLVQLPGMEGVPKGVTACTVGNGQVGFIATLAIIAGLEAAVFVQDPNKEPGNFGNPLPLVGDDYSDEMRARELNNGRIAMFSAVGIIASGLYTGNSAIEQFGA